jgi:heptosyltransferase-3
MSYGDYPDLKNVKRILVVKMRHHGDVLLSSPVFSNLKKEIPDAEIDAFIYKDTLPMLEGHPTISNFLLYDRGWKKLSLFKKLAKEAELFNLIRKNKYDMVVNLTEGDRGAFAALFSNARIRVGFDPEGKGFIGKKKVYTHVVKNCKTPRHAVERQLDALRRIGIFPEPEDRDLTLYIAEEARVRIKTLVPDEYIVVHPVSRWRFKCWPVHLVAEMIEQLHEKGHKIVLTGSPDSQEMAMNDEIVKLIPGVPVINLSGKISLKELGAVIEKAKCLVSVDSVPLHMASSLKTPVVVLFGPSSDQNWGPWMHPKGKVVAKKMSCRPCFMDGCGGSKMSDCLHTLPVRTVIDSVSDLLSGAVLPLISSHTEH